MTAEELYIKNIENGIRAIRLGTKKPSETLAPINLNKLKQMLSGETLQNSIVEKHPTHTTE